MGEKNGGPILQNTAHKGKLTNRKKERKKGEKKAECSKPLSQGGLKGFMSRFGSEWILSKLTMDYTRHNQTHAPELLHHCKGRHRLLAIMLKLLIDFSAHRRALDKAEKWSCILLISDDAQLEESRYHRCCCIPLARNKGKKRKWSVVRTSCKSTVVHRQVAYQFCDDG